MEKLVLIDGNSLINRAFYANPPMTTKDGAPTGAVFGFINMMFKMFNDIKPTYLSVAFDVHAPTFRHGMFSDYKGTRKPMPEELRPQIPLLKELLTLMNINFIEKAGFEADDIIGAVAKSTKIQTIIITGDRDSFQLVDDETTVYFTKRGLSDIDILDISNFTEKTGITPPQVIELKALMGDSSDNIPGVKGVGEKTALTLVQKYGSVENLYEHLEDFSGKLLEKLTLGKEMCFLSKKLATIDTNFDIPMDTSKMTIKMPFSSKVKERFTELEFKTFIKKPELFEKNEVFQEDKIEIKNIISEAELDKIFSSEKLALIISDDINIFTFKNIEYKIKIKDNFFDEGFSFEDILPRLKKLFSENKTIIVFGKKALKHSFDIFNFTYNAKIQDVSIMKYLADFTGKDEKLSDVFDEYNLDKTTPSASLAKLYEKLSVKIKEEDLEKLYNEIELPLADVLYDMENAGFKIDITALDQLSQKFNGELKILEEKIYLVSGEKFNINSPKQLSVVLFEKLNLKHEKKNKSGYSTGAEVLENLENEHAVIPLILKYRQLNKLVSTYIDGFKPLIEKETGLIHTSFNQMVTTTGRLSSKEPNLQNIPVRDEIGKEIRKFFVAKDENHILIGADYSQIELRLLAHFSGCKKLIEAYKNNADIHTLTASEVFNVKFDEVTKEMRRSAKAVNFGIIYGISEYGLAKNIKTSNATARNYIKTYFEKYPEVKEYMNKNVEFAKANGYVSTLLNRKRYLREINSSNFNLRSFAERAAMNMPLQGSSADIIKIAMVNVYNRLIKEGLKSKLILQVHDELIIDALKSEQPEVTRLLIEEMEGAVKLSVPLTVETEIGETWFDAK